MTKNEFIVELEKSLEITPNTIKVESNLEEFGWDSLSIIVFITLVDTKFGVSITPTQIVECKTVSDLINVVGNRFSS